MGSPSRRGGEFVATGYREVNGLLTDWNRAGDLLNVLTHVQRWVAAYAEWPLQLQSSSRQILLSVRNDLI